MVRSGSLKVLNIGFLICVCGVVKVENGLVRFVFLKGYFGVFVDNYREICMIEVSLVLGFFC